MNKRWFVLLGACAVIVSAVLIWGPWKWKGQPGRSTKDRRSAIMGPTSAAMISVSPRGPRKNSFVPGAPPTEAQIAQRRARWAPLFHTPIAVYGKVIDERGDPISDATVEIATVNGVQSAARDLKTTDGGGLFSVTGKQGLGFSLRASKNGYYTTKQSTAYRNVLAPSKTDSPNSTPEEPIVLVLRKQGNAESLVVRKTGQIDVPKNGDKVYVRLAEKFTGSGELQISSWIGAPDRGRFDWRYTLSIPDGGIIERFGEFDFAAPVAGYVQSIEHGVSASTPSWSTDGKKEYFAKLPDGRYGRFSISFYPSQQRNFVVISGFVNPVPGHRNLEFDPKKAQKPGR